MRKQKSQSRFLFFCTAPAMLLIILFMIYPTLSVFRMSLYKWGGYSPNKQFVGLRNFQILFSDQNFLRAFENSILLIVMVTIFTIGLSLVFAAMPGVKGKSFFRIVFYIPNVLSIVVVAAIFSAIYDPTRGLLNSFLALFQPTGTEPVYWLGSQKTALWAVVIALIWQAIGYYMVMYIASMSAVPASLYESAELDGASSIKQFFAITLPLIWTNIRTTLTFFIISTINLSFMLVKAMTNGNPDGATEVFLTYMYKQAYTNSSYGYGMAIGVIVFLFSFALSALVSFSTKREPLEY